MERAVVIAGRRGATRRLGATGRRRAGVGEDVGGELDDEDAAGLEDGLLGRSGSETRERSEQEQIGAAVLMQNAPKFETECLNDAVKGSEEPGAADGWARQQASIEPFVGVSGTKE